MKLSGEARSTFTEHLFLSGRCFLFNSEDVELSILGENEHALSRE